MKILLVQDHLRSGGTERQSVLLANAFAAAGHDCTLLTFRPGGALNATVSPAVHRKVLQPFDTRLDWLAPRLLAVARRLSPEIVLCMGRMSNCYAGSLQSALPQAVVIGTLRTGKSLPFLFRRSLHRVRHIVANSRDARDLLVNQHHVPAENTSVIYNSLVFPGSSISSVSRVASRNPDADTLRAQHGATPSTFILLCVAMFRPEKHQRELIEIAASLPPTVDWQLWLAGAGPARPACEALAAQRKVADRVRFLGFQKDPSALYLAANLAVHASSSESLSNFFIEAQAHGLPAVAYEAQGIAETFVPNRTGWVIPRGDRDAFRNALLRVQTLPAADRASLADEARTFARTTFDPARQVDAYLSLFMRLRDAARTSAPRAAVL